jgi:hypothetical protein
MACELYDIAAAGLALDHPDRSIESLAPGISRFDHPVVR